MLLSCEMGGGILQRGLSPVRNFLWGTGNEGIDVVMMQYALDTFNSS